MLCALLKSVFEDCPGTIFTVPSRTIYLNFAFIVAYRHDYLYTLFSEVLSLSHPRISPVIRSPPVSHPFIFLLFRTAQNSIRAFFPPASIICAVGPTSAVKRTTIPEVATDDNETILQEREIE